MTTTLLPQQRDTPMINSLVQQVWKFYKDRSDLDDYGTKRSGYISRVKTTHLLERLNGQSTRSPLTLDHFRRHFLGIRGLHIKAHPQAKHITLIGDVDSRKGATDGRMALERILEYIYREDAQKVYTEETSPGSFLFPLHLYLDFEEEDATGETLVKTLDGIKRAIQKVLKAEGFSAYLDDFKGKPTIYGHTEDRGIFTINRTDMGRVPSFPQGIPDFDRFKGSPELPLSLLIERSSSLVPDVFDPLKDNQQSRIHSKSQKLSIKTISNSSCYMWVHFPSPPTASTLRNFFSSIGKETIEEARGLGADKRTHAAYTWASRLWPSAIASPEAFLEWYELLPDFATGERNSRRTRRIRDFWQWRQDNPARRPFEEWELIVTSLVSPEDYKNQLLKGQSSRSVPRLKTDYVAAVLACITSSILHPTKRSLAFTQPDSGVENYLKKLYAEGVIKSHPGLKRKRLAALRLLQLSGLIVLRDDKYRWCLTQRTFDGERKVVHGEAKRYGLGALHPDHAAYETMCTRLGVDAQKVDPKCLSLIRSLT